MTTGYLDLAVLSALSSNKPADSPAFCERVSSLLDSVKAGRYVSQKNINMPKEKRLLKEFLETYKFLPCLWDPKDKFYLNKDARSQALEILVDKYRVIDSEASVDAIKKRLENMRCAYKREYKKVVASRMHGNGPEMEYVPTLWYYKYLLFLDEKDDPAVEKTDYSTDDDDDNTPIYTGLSKKRRRSTNGAAVYIVNKEEDPTLGPAENITKPNSFNTSIDDNEADSFGKTVGLQLKRLDDMQRHIGEKLISEIIYYARLNQLNTRTQITLSEDFT